MQICQTRKYLWLTRLGEHVNIKATNPNDGINDSSTFVDGSDPADFEAQLEIYKAQKDELLSFYNHYGLLVDFPLRTGFDDYEKIK